MVLTVNIDYENIYTPGHLQSSPGGLCLYVFEYQFIDTGAWRSSSYGFVWTMLMTSCDYVTDFNFPSFYNSLIAIIAITV